MSDTYNIFTLKNKRHVPNWLAWLFAGVMRLYVATLRKTWHDPASVLTPGNEDIPTLFVFWHNRILLAPPILPEAIRRKVYVMVSASRDGEYIASIIKQFQMTPIRGSSSRGGISALRDALEVMHNGCSTIISVDGPRGPRYSVHPGAAMLGAKGYRLVPYCMNAKHYWQFRSWDAMQLPLPFTKVDINFGAPIELPQDCDVGQGCAKIKDALMAITQDDPSKPIPQKCHRH